MENETQKIIGEKCRACNSSSWTLWGHKNKHNLYKCSSCATVSVLPVPLNENIRSVYTEDYFSGAVGGFGYQNYEADKEALRGVLTRILEGAKKYLKAGESGQIRHLDVGTATGYFVKLARELGFHSSGIELSAYAVEKARAQGLDVSCATLTHFAKDNFNNKYDLITVMDVIEHISEPTPDLTAARDLLNDNGILLMITPNPSSLYARILKDRWHIVVPPEHIHLYSKAGMRRLLSSNNFEILEIKNLYKDYSLSYTLGMAGNWLNINLLRKLAGKLGGTFIGNIKLPIYLGDNMLVIARKK